ncbi:hypothetical protein PF008_g26110 [Phytophthora fragariae]|uniref:Uncharacterized protein n=1 Tax=Phytophthora fragariae TaxID=53985 RepID=A0A6G0QI51_9STRA|nr:hypothetical protein PF008_g26110 [Phytophthora fragariae]
MAHAGKILNFLAIGNIARACTVICLNRAVLTTNNLVENMKSSNHRSTNIAPDTTMS